MLKEMLRMEKLCAAIGFTKEMIESLLTKKETIRCNGRIYSEEHRRKFDIKNDIFKVEKNPTDDSKLILTINKQSIDEWFKEQFGKLGHSFRKAPNEPRKGGGFRLLTLIHSYRTEGVIKKCWLLLFYSYFCAA